MVLCLCKSGTREPWGYLCIGGLPEEWSITRRAIYRALQHTKQIRGVTELQYTKGFQFLWATYLFACKILHACSFIWKSVDADINAHQRHWSMCLDQSETPQWLLKFRHISLGEAPRNPVGIHKPVWKPVHYTIAVLILRTAIRSCGKHTAAALRLL